MADALCVDDNVMLFTALAVVDDIVDQLLLIVIVTLRKQDILRPVCDTAPQCNVAGISAHYLDDTAAFMGGRCIAHLVDRFHRRIDCGVKTDRIIRTCNVQVNRARHTNRVDAACRQLLCTCKRTVAADDYKAVNAMLMADLCTKILSLRCTELRTAGCIQDRTAL